MPEQWFTDVFQVAEAHRQLVTEALSSLSSDIGVSWTQLRPDDTFERDLRVRPRFIILDDLYEAEIAYIKTAEKYSIPVERLPGFVGSIGEFISELIAVSQSETDSRGSQCPLPDM